MFVWTFKSCNDKGAQKNNMSNAKCMLGWGRVQCNWTLKQLKYVK